MYLKRLIRYDNYRCDMYRNYKNALYFIYYIFKMEIVVIFFNFSNVKLDYTY